MVSAPAAFKFPMQLQPDMTVCRISYVNYARWAMQGLAWSEEHSKTFAHPESIVSGLPGATVWQLHAHVHCVGWQLHVYVHVHLQLHAHVCCVA